MTVCFDFIKHLNLNAKTIENIDSIINNSHLLNVSNCDSKNTCCIINSILEFLETEITIANLENFMIAANSHFVISEFQNNNYNLKNNKIGLKICHTHKDLFPLNNLNVTFNSETFDWRNKFYTPNNASFITYPTPLNFNYVLWYNIILPGQYLFLNNNITQDELYNNNYYCLNSRTITY